MKNSFLKIYYKIYYFLEQIKSKFNYFLILF